MTDGRQQRQPGTTSSSHHRGSKGAVSINALQAQLRVLQNAADEALKFTKSSDDAPGQASATSSPQMTESDHAAARKKRSWQLAFDDPDSSTEEPSYFLNDSHGTPKKAAMTKIDDNDQQFRTKTSLEPKHGNSAVPQHNRGKQARSHDHSRELKLQDHTSTHPLSLSRIVSSVHSARQSKLPTSPKVDQEIATQMREDIIKDSKEELDDEQDSARQYNEQLKDASNDLVAAASKAREKFQELEKERGVYEHLDMEATAKAEVMAQVLNSLHKARKEQSGYKDMDSKQRENKLKDAEDRWRYLVHKSSDVFPDEIQKYFKQVDDETQESTFEELKDWLKERAHSVREHLPPPFGENLDEQQAVGLTSAEKAKNNAQAKAEVATRAEEALEVATAMQVQAESEAKEAKREKKEEMAQQEERTWQSLIAQTEQFEERKRQEREEQEEQEKHEEQERRWQQERERHEFKVRQKEDRAEKMHQEEKSQEYEKDREKKAPQEEEVRQEEKQRAEMARREEKAEQEAMKLQEEKSRQEEKVHEDKAAQEKNERQDGKAQQEEKKMQQENQRHEEKTEQGTVLKKNETAGSKQDQNTTQIVTELATVEKARKEETALREESAHLLEADASQKELARKKAWQQEKDAEEKRLKEAVAKRRREEAILADRAEESKRHAFQAFAAEKAAAAAVNRAGLTKEDAVKALHSVSSEALHVVSEIYNPQDRQWYHPKVEKWRQEYEDTKRDREAQARWNKQNEMIQGLRQQAAPAK
eukprot:gnl/TRDRNA2_/TRDRNA2_187817_c0_seq1.p1 gnl/TRDRNA2_/TRDRNA2_187817_c0~~gnl/TRDRNA2_/TRDRNA2_187817_c0_seq1.p1  ORF type:complete len:878 (+),score=255.03 gnl/TRDRNA2_/TRDRNA2_187817_c0_seq1:351-2636(+)